MNTSYRSVICGAFSLVICTIANSQNLTQQQADQIATDAAEKAVAETQEKEFAGLKFGAGLSITFDTGSTQRVNSASIVDGLVRVEEDDDKIARVMLESHYFFLTGKERLGLPAGQIGWGPFMALQPGTDEIIEAIGVGLMVGFRRGESDDSWNMGLGYVVDPDVKVLGDGFMANQAPPGSETAVRFKETSQEGWFLIFSFSF